MRPLRLCLSAFGPFAGVEMIDFRAALDSRLFGIYGPTGAGKTSVLDGICYALFGESSGDERKGDDLRSHHAAATCETEVSFVFEAGQKTYHIVRRPRQTGAAKRGGGVTERAHWAGLYDATGMPLDEISSSNPGAVLEERKVDLVASRLADILGYDASQFRQVVLLPQGKFRQLLIAKSDERSEVLRGLFDVGLYERLTERLKARAGDLKDEVERQRSLIAGRLDAHGAATVEALVLQVEEAAVDLEARKVQRDLCREQHAAAKTVWEAASLIEGRFREKAAAEDTLNALLANDPAIDVVRNRRAAAQKASACIHLDERAAEAKERVVACGKQIATAREAVAAKLRALEAARTELNQSNARQAEREAAASHLATLKSFAPRLAKAAPLRAERTRAEQALKDIRSRLASAQSAQAEAKALVEQLEDALASLALAKEQARDLEGRRKSLEVERDACRDYLGKAAALAALAEQKKAAEKAAAAAKAELATAAARKEKAEAALSASQAVHLAGRLELGQPCMVCGSREHPAPATGGEGGETLEAEMREAARLWLEASEFERARGQAFAEASGGHKEAEKALSLAVKPRRDIEPILAELADIENRLTALGGVDSAAVDQQLAQARPALQAADKELGRLQIEFTQADKALATADATLVSGLADIPEPLREESALSAAIAAADELRTQLMASHTAATDAERAAAEAHQAAALHEGQAVQDLAAASADEAARCKAFDAALKKAGLDAKAYTAAKDDVPELENLAQTISDHEKSLAVSRAQVAEAVKQISDQPRPDLPALEAALRLQEGLRDEAQASVTRSEVLLGQLRDTQAAVAEMAGQLDQAAADYACVGQLAKLTDGGNALKLRLRDYAIAATLDQVLEAANVRFERMSQGRFTLLRKLEGGDRRSATGLDIEVHDAHTDQKRDAHTLSGGEGFLASLSLALGLSDVVQAESGGIKLDAIFIDEGFGHLDDETLDIALDTLRDLVGQDRAVGVISHVDAVKQQIPAGFEISRTLQGSTVRARTAA